MAVTVERLIATLEARFDKYDRALNKALGNTNRTFTRIETRGKQLERRLATMGAGFGSSLTKALAVAGGIRGFQSLLDASTRVDNALKVVGLSGQELERVYERLRKAAADNGAPLETLVSLYSRMMQSQKGLKASSEEIESLTERIAEGLRVQGVSAEQARGPLQQLAQSFSSVIVRAEEFNSLSEGMPIILHAVAAGLKEANGDIGKLRSLVIAGKVSSEAWFRALEAGSGIIQQKVGGATLTVGQGLENMRTAMIDAAREFSKGSIAAESLGDAFAVMADRINSVNFEDFGKEVRELVERLGQLQSAMSWVQNLGANFGAATGLDSIGKWATGGAVQRRIGPITVTSSQALQERIDRAFGDAVDTASGLTEEAIRRSAGQIVNEAGKTGRLPSSTVTPVSLSDFDAPEGKKKGGKRENDYAREARQIQERTAALMAETAAMAGLNPLVDDYGYTLEKVRATQELLTAAKRAGIAVTPELEASIEQLADGYANATVEAAKLSEAQDKVRDRAEEMRSLGKDVLGGFIQDLRDGKSASEALANALGRVADKLLDIALEDLFSSKSGSGGGILSLLTGLFRERGGPVKKGQPYIVGEKRPELFVPDQDGHILPSVPAAPSPSSLASGRSGAASYSAIYNIDARGAQRGVGEEVAAAIAAYDKGRKARLAVDLPDLRRRMGAL